MSTSQPRTRKPARCTVCHERTSDLKLISPEGAIPKTVLDLAHAAAVHVPDAYACTDALACLHRAYDARR